MKNADKLIAVVTGANKGIGFEIARQLGKRGVRVILTARDEAKGKAAAEKLKQQNFEVEFHPLDVSKSESIQVFGKYMQKEIGRLDILVNNAGVFGSPAGAAEVDMQTVETVMRTNVYGPLQLTQVLLPILKKSPRGRVVNMSSGMGSLSEMGGGYGAYRMSKTALNSITAIFAAELTDSAVAVNTMCPGWVKTDMGGQNAPRSVEEGADTAVWLALDAPDDLRGKFLRDRKVIAW